MKRRAKELQQAKRDAKKGRGIGGGGYSGISSQDYGRGSGYMPVAETQSYEPVIKPTYNQPR